MRAVMLATLPAVAFLTHAAGQAQSSSAQMCLAWVYDESDDQRIMLVSDIFDFQSVPDLEQTWRRYLAPAVKKALDQFGEGGRLDVQCSDKPVSYTKMAGIRANIMEVGQHKGLLVDTVSFPNAALAQKGSDMADPGGSAEVGGDETGPSSASTNARGSNSTVKDPGMDGDDALRYVAVPSSPPPAGYSNWTTHYDNNRVRVEYAYSASPNEIRVIWRCTNESNKDASCSVGAGSNVEYQCWNANSSLGSSYMPGQRSTVRAGKSMSFPSDWACRDVKGATSVVPIARISIER
jgi:hypothetical protein